MNKTSSVFKIVFLGFFAVFLLGGVISFALYSSSGQLKKYSEIVIWGTLPEEKINAYLDKIKSEDKASPINAKYYQVKPENFTQVLTENLANGMGPDVVLVPAKLLAENGNKINPIPYTAYPERVFKNAYVEEGELFLSNIGVLAVPLVIDPLVMYWNRDIFADAGLVEPPKYWEDFLDLSKKISKKDENFNVLKTAIPFGEYVNVTNAKEVISTLLLQAGAPITSTNIEGIAADFKGKGVVSAVKFFTTFSDPVSPYYSWNRKLPASKDFFLSGNSAVYFGLASELRDLNLKNPNLNFDASVIPQLKDAPRRTTYADVYGLAILKRTSKFADAYSTIQLLTGDTYLPFLSDITKLPPVRRSLLSKAQSDPFISVFYDSAIISKGWLEPGNKGASQVFSTLISAITSNALDVEKAVNQANESMSALFRNRSGIFETQ